MAVTQWTDGVINSLSSLKIGSPKPPLKKEVFCYNVFGKCYNMMYLASKWITMKRTTIYLSPEVHEKLLRLAERKKWSVTKTVEFILLKSIKDRTNVKESNS